MKIQHDLATADKGVHGEAGVKRIQILSLWHYTVSSTVPSTWCTTNICIVINGAYQRAESNIVRC